MRIPVRDDLGQIIGTYHDRHEPVWRVPLRDALEAIVHEGPAEPEAIKFIVLEKWYWRPAMELKSFPCWRVNKKDAKLLRAYLKKKKRLKNENRAHRPAYTGAG